MAEVEWVNLLSLHCQIIPKGTRGHRFTSTGNVGKVHARGLLVCCLCLFISCSLKRSLPPCCIPSCKVTWAYLHSSLPFFSHNILVASFSAFNSFLLTETSGLLMWIPWLILAVKASCMHMNFCGSKSYSNLITSAVIMTLKQHTVTSSSFHIVHFRFYTQIFQNPIALFFFSPEEC